MQTRRNFSYYLSRFLILLVVLIYLIPIYWIIATSLKSSSDISAQFPKFFFKITFKNYQKLFASKYFSQLLNSIIIGFTSTILAVSIGTLSAYAFSRFKVAGEDDLLFFILSTRMLPPIVVVIPIYLMYTVLRLRDTHFGLILLKICIFSYFDHFNEPKPIFAQLVSPFCEHYTPLLTFRNSHWFYLEILKK